MQITITGGRARSTCMPLLWVLRDGLGMAGTTFGCGMMLCGAFTMRLIARVTVVTLLAGLLAGCGENWRATTYDPRRACQSFGGGYWESGGTCRSGAP